MDLHEQRMQCLRKAFELGGKPEAVLSAAQQLFDFITGPPASSSADTEEAALSTPSTAVDIVPDAIASCGTALLMQEGGDLVNAVAEPAISISGEATESKMVSEETQQFEDLGTDAVALEDATSTEP